MIRYTLACNNGHQFESWFANSAGYEALRAAGHVTCPDCGSMAVNKTLMAPAVRPARAAPDATPHPATATAAPPTAPAHAADRAAALRRLKAEIEAKSDYVGMSFASEARRMHAGEVPERMIHGEARPEDARALIEEGVPVAPLPFIPKRRTN